MRRRWHSTEAQEDESRFCESSLSEVRLSTDLSQQCRFILLGGDETAKNDACHFILRTPQSQQFQRSNPHSCEKKENCVQGRHVCVVKTPSYWLEHLSTCWFISSGVKTIQNEMKHCISLVFPGPHAFLLVVRAGHDVQTERYLLQAIRSVFGSEAENFSMLLFVKRPEERNSQYNMSPSVLNFGQYHLLENTDESAQVLFRKVEKMISQKSSKFFIPSAYEHFMKINFEQWEKERIDLLSESSDKVNELSKELEEMKRMQDRQQEADHATGINLIDWGSNDFVHPDL
ncbi:GTPase IMAP family member 4-like isoform X2 [Hemibagrus wyckioides]|uniref:GTPase IMAP family member 4-like isoform X2 n=1 Tax=Hemibagrus wyckioides TaxID=337641 RepID=UPI00266BCB65|nr:GTPase IMAP family member 4-like isoform X2 [Hemibagrus wyckioides]